MTEAKSIEKPSTIPDLPGLAEGIRSEVALAREAAASVVEHAAQAGVLLLEAKAAMPHGEWGGWLDEHLRGDLSPRTARLYMQLARRRREVTAEEWQRVADLPMRHAIGALQETRRHLQEPAAPPAPGPTPAPPPARVEREWDRARNRAAEAREAIEKHLARVQRLPIPTKVEDFKAWKSTLDKLGYEANYAAQDLAMAPHRIENPPPDPHEVTYVTVKLAPTEADLPDLAREDVRPIFARRGDEDFSESWVSDSADMLIMDPENWCFDHEPHGEGWWRWVVIVEGPREPLWVRGFWSLLGESTHTKHEADPRLRDDSLRAHIGRPGWTNFGLEA